MPELEQKKKQLEELRNFHRPLQKTDFTEHAVKYERLKQLKLEENKRQRDLSLQAQKDHYANLRYKPKDVANTSLLLSEAKR
jgi:hypothetical protein